MTSTATEYRLSNKINHCAWPLVIENFLSQENLATHEKNLVGNILLGFAQTECAVSDYWTTMVTKWFPKHEIKQMAMMFGSQETIHATAYSYLNETLGLENFEAFLHEPAIAEKFEFF